MGERGRLSVVLERRGRVEVIICEKKGLVVLESVSDRGAATSSGLSALRLVSMGNVSELSFLGLGAG